MLCYARNVDIKHDQLSQEEIEEKRLEVDLQGSLGSFIDVRATIVHLHVDHCQCIHTPLAQTTSSEELTFQDVRCVFVCVESVCVRVRWDGWDHATHIPPSPTPRKTARNYVPANFHFPILHWIVDTQPFDPPPLSSPCHRVRSIFFLCCSC